MSTRSTNEAGLGTTSRATPSLRLSLIRRLPRRARSRRRAACRRHQVSNGPLQVVNARAHLVDAPNDGLGHRLKACLLRGGGRGKLAPRRHNGHAQCPQARHHRGGMPAPEPRPRSARTSPYHLLEQCGHLRSETRDAGCDDVRMGVLVRTGAGRRECSELSRCTIARGGCVRQQACDMDTARRLTWPASSAGSASVADGVDCTPAAWLAAASDIATMLS